jgi:glycosyltransferase involved in cell wall biosynthesis
MKILINTPPPSNIGGVANHYKGLKKYWTEDVCYNYIGGRKGIPGSVIIIFDLLKFIYKCLAIRPHVVVLNPSLGKTAIMRDGLFLRASKFLGYKTVVFFHGWDEKQEAKIDRKPKSFVKKFNKADAFLVLASSFQKKMKEWRITKPIQLTTTKVDDNLICDFDIKDKVYGKKLLFLARIVKEKGIFTTLRSFKKIKERYPQAELTVAGSGKALDGAKSFVKHNSISNVSFTGFITGKKLQKVFRNSDLYLFPTEHGEGMPTSVLEAMAFGLPVISRPVGGMLDFFEENKMGYLLETTDASNHTEKVIELFENEERLEKIGRYNHKYAKENFLASKVARNLERVFKEVLG